MPFPGTYKKILSTYPYNFNPPSAISKKTIPRIPPPVPTVHVLIASYLTAKDKSRIINYMHKHPQTPSFIVSYPANFPYTLTVNISPFLQFPALLPHHTPPPPTQKRERNPQISQNPNTKIPVFLRAPLRAIA